MNNNTRSSELALIPRKEDALAAADVLDHLKAVPEEDVWLKDLRSEHTKRAYREAVADFVWRLEIRSREDFRKIERGAVLAWREAMKGTVSFSV